MPDQTWSDGLLPLRPGPCSQGTRPVAVGFEADPAAKAAATAATEAEVRLERGDLKGAADCVRAAGEGLVKGPVRDRASGAARLLPSVQRVLARCEEERDRLSSELARLRKQKSFREVPASDSVNGVWFTGSA